MTSLVFPQLARCRDQSIPKRIGSYFFLYDVSFKITVPRNVQKFNHIWAPLSDDQNDFATFRNSQTNSHFPWLTTLRGSAESSWAQYVLLMNVFYIFDDFLWICHTLIENTKPTVVYPKNYQRPLKNNTFWWIVNLYTQTLVHHPPPPLPDRNSVMEIL